MNSTEEAYGSLLFFRKNGQPSTAYPVANGKITIGSSSDADIRLKMNDKRLEDIHCVIEANEAGIVTLFNKSVSEPVKVNNLFVRKSRILKEDDEIELVGKKFVYLKGNNTKMNLDNRPKSVKNINLTPSKKRHSTASLLNLKSGKKSPMFKTKTPIQLRPSTRRLCASTSSDFVVTYEEPIKGNLSNRSKTTSKVIVSKAVGSPGSSKKRRLSFGDKPKQIDRNLKMSTRNVLLSKHIISTINEDEKVTSPKLSTSMSKLDKSLEQNNEWNQHLDNDLSSEDLVGLNLSSNSSVSPIMSSSESTISSSSPRKSSSRKSLIKRHLSEGRVSKSPRKSLLQQCLRKNQDKVLTTPRGSLRKSKTGEFKTQFLNESPNLNKSAGLSARKSKTMAKSKEDQLEKQFSSEESGETPNTSRSRSRNKSLSMSKVMEKGEEETVSEPVNSNTSFNKTRMLLNKSKSDKEVVEQFEIQSPIEELLLLPDSQTPNKSLRKSRLSLNKSKSINESVTKSRKSKAIENREEQKDVSLDKSGTREDITISRQSLRKTKANEARDTRQSKQNEQFLILDISESQSPNKSARTRRSLSVYDNISVDNALVTPNQRISLKKDSVVDNDGFDQDTLMRLSSNFAKLRSPNIETSKEKRFSTKRSFGADGEQAKDSLLNTSIKTRETKTPKETRSSVRKSNGSNRNGNNLELQSSEESFVLNVSAKDTPKQASIQRQSISPVRRSNILNKGDDTEEQSSSEDSLVLNLSLESTKETFMQKPAQKQMRESLVRRSNGLNKDEKVEDIEEQSFNEESLCTMVSPASIKKTMQKLTTPQEVRELSVRKSNRLRKDKEIEESSNEEVFVLNISPMNTTIGTPMQRRFTTTPRETMSAVGTPNIRESSTRKNKLNKEKEVGEQDLTEKSFSLNISALNGSIVTSKRRSTTTPRKTETLLKKSRVSEIGNGLNGNEEFGELSSSKDFFVSNSSTNNTSKAKNLQRGSTATPKGVFSVKETEENTSSLRKSNRLDQGEKSCEQSSSEESFVLNISAVNSPEQTSLQRFSKGTVIPVELPKERRSSIRKSNRLNTDEENNEIYSLIPIKTSTERRSSMRKSDKVNHGVEIREVSSSEDYLGSSLSEMNTSKELLIRSHSTATPNQMSPLGSSTRKNKSVRDEEFGELSFVEDMPVTNISKVNKRSSVRKNKSIGNEGLLTPTVSTMNSSKETSAQKHLTKTPKELMVSVRTPIVNRSPMRKSGRLNELSPREVSSNISVSYISSPNEKSVQKISMAPKQREFSMRKSRKLIKDENGEMFSDEEFLVENTSTVNKRTSVRKNNKSIGDDLFVSVASGYNTPKDTSIQKQLTRTPKEMMASIRSPIVNRSSSRKSDKLNELSLREESRNISVSNISSSSKKSVHKLCTTPKERESSMRKSTKSIEDEVAELFSEEFLDANTSTVSKRSSVRKNKSLGDEELFIPVSGMNTSKDTSRTPTEMMMATVGTPNENRFSMRKSNRLSELTSSRNSLNVTVSDVGSPKEKSIQKTPKENRESSVGKNTKLVRDEEIDEVLLAPMAINTSRGSSRHLTTIPKKSIRSSTERSSVRKNNRLSREEIDELSSSEDSLVSPIDRSVEETAEKQSSTRKNSHQKNDSRLSNRNSTIFYMSNFKNSTPIPTSRVNDTSNEAFQQSNFSSLSESDFYVESPKDRITPKLRHSSVRKSHLKTEEEASEMETSYNVSSRARVSSTRRSSKNISAKLDKARLTHSKQNISVITVNDSIELTPENNTSVIILNTSFENSQKSLHKRLSKTLNSTLQDDPELTTPKSAIKGRRLKSLPYNPLVEEITPVTPLSKSKNESGFKTPLNTPGLFEDIKKSVLRSRSQMQKSSANLMDKLNKREPKRGVKRSLEEGSVESSKRRKIVNIESSSTFDTSNEADDGSFESFSTVDVLTDMSEQNITPKTPNTPKHFSDLTDKPVITHPQLRRSMETKRRKSEPLRKSVSSIRVSSQLSSADGSNRVDLIISTDSTSDLNDSVFELSSNPSSRRSSRRSSLRTQSTQDDDSSNRIQESPKNDLSDAAGLKKLLRTSRETKPSKNYLTNVPKVNNSPRNDLTNIIGVKKLLATPRQMNSPKNDLRQIPNLRKFMSPKQQNSPKNDLSNVAGVKKLLGSPNSVKSPKNDLRNIPNLRRLMSPKTQNSPKNDLSDVGGVRQLFSTPKSQKSPKKDHTNVPNLRRIMSPKQQNTPNNDLNDVHSLKKSRELGVDDNSFNMSGVQRLSIESDIENNGDLFDKLFAKKPLRTYRGKSLSPASRKSLMFGDKRKTMGEVPLTSPRVEKWLEEQAVFKLDRMENSNVKEAMKKPQGTPTKDKISDVQEPQKRIGRGKRMKKEAIEEPSTSKELAAVQEQVIQKRVVRGRKVQEILTDEVDNENKEISHKKEVENGNISPFINEDKKVGSKRRIKQALDGEPDAILVKKTTRSRRKVNEDVNEEIKPKAKQTAMAIRAQQSKEVDHINEYVSNEVNSTSEIVKFKFPKVIAKGRPRKISQKEQIDQIPEVHSTTEDIKSPASKRGRGRRAINQDESSEVSLSLPKRRGRTRNTVQVENLDTIQTQSEEEEIPQPKRLRGKRKSPVKKDEDTESDVKVEEENVHPKRGRGRKIKLVGEKEQTIGEPDKSPVITKKTRGRKQNLVVASKSNPDTTTSEEETRIVDQSETEVDTSKIRGRKNVGKNKKKATVNEEKIEAEPIKSTRARRQPAVTNVELHEANEEENRITGVVKKTNKKAIEKSSVKDDTEMASPKSTRGRRRLEKTAKKVAASEEEENESTDVDVTKMTTAKPTRGRKRFEKATSKIEENEVDANEFTDDATKQASAKPTRGRKRLQTNGKVEESEKEENMSTKVDPMKQVSPKPTRGRKRLDKKTSKVEVSEEGEESTEVDVTKMASVKPSKGRKRIEKVTDKFEESREEESDPIEVEKAGKGRGRKAIDKTKLVEDSVTVDSPRTRAKKGNFNKYGSDFLTPQGKKQDKHVRFEERDTLNNKRKVRNESKTEEVEETIRRPKRARK